MKVFKFMESLKFLGSLEFMRSLKYMAMMMVILGMGVMTVSCDPVHQFPEMQEEPELPVDPDDPNDPEPDPEDPDEPKEPEEPTPPESDSSTTLKLYLKYFTDFTYSNYIFDSRSATVKEASVKYGDTYDNLDNIPAGTPMKVTVKVHLDNNNRTLVASKTFTTVKNVGFDDVAEIEVPTGYDYLVTVWSHLLDEKGNAFYDESDFNSIELVKSSFRGNTDMRDAFRGRLKVSPTEAGELQGTVNMRRPMCKLEFVTTGLQEFITAEEKRMAAAAKSRAVDPGDYTVVISYPAYYPSHYMAMDDRLEFASTGYSFTTPITVLDDDNEEASMGFDYVLINDSADAAVQVQVSVYHSDGTQVASTGQLTVPMERDTHVVVRGTILSSNNSGGVGIDPDFEGDFNIPVH